jgi:hypothetical protein
MTETDDPKAEPTMPALNHLRELFNNRSNSDADYRKYIDAMSQLLIPFLDAHAALFRRAEAAEEACETFLDAWDANPANTGIMFVAIRKVRAALAAREDSLPDIPDNAKAEPMTHSRGCPCSYGEPEDPCCTCGLKHRIVLQTEQEMHAAWRKRAEEAEADLAAKDAEIVSLKLLQGGSYQIGEISGVMIFAATSSSTHANVISAMFAIMELAGKEAPSKDAEIARLNQMIRETGQGQGAIDAYVAQCEEMERKDAQITALTKALNEAKQNVGALWTIISKISEPIRRCFCDRTMSFKEFSEIAVEWEKSISGDAHPDTLRAEIAALARQVEAAKALYVASGEVMTVVDQAYEATGFIRVAKTSEQRLRIEAARLRWQEMHK